MEGHVKSGLESTIIDCTARTLLKTGRHYPESIATALSEAGMTHITIAPPLDDRTKPIAPGQLKVIMRPVRH